MRRAAYPDIKDNETLREKSTERAADGMGGIDLDCAAGNSSWVRTFGGISSTADLLPLPPRTVVGPAVSEYPGAVEGQWRGGSIIVSDYFPHLLLPPFPTLVSSRLFKFGTTAHAGLRFEIDDETHYGWVLINEVDPNNGLVGAAFVVEYAYETDPDTPIVIPEPSTVGLLAITGLAFFVRRCYLFPSAWIDPGPLQPRR